MRLHSSRRRRRVRPTSADHPPHEDRTVSRGTTRTCRGAAPAASSERILSNRVCSAHRPISRRRTCPSRTIRHLSLGGARSVLGRNTGGSDPTRYRRDPDARRTSCGPLLGRGAWTDQRLLSIGWQHACARFVSSTADQHRHTGRARDCSATRSGLLPSTDAAQVVVRRPDGPTSLVHGLGKATEPCVVTRHGADPFGPWTATPAVRTAVPLHEGELAAALVVLTADPVDGASPLGSSPSGRASWWSGPVDSPVWCPPTGRSPGELTPVPDRSPSTCCGPHHTQLHSVHRCT